MQRIFFSFLSLLTFTACGTTANSTNSPLTTCVPTNNMYQVATAIQNDFARTGSTITASNPSHIVTEKLAKQGTDLFGNSHYQRIEFTLMPEKSCIRVNSRFYSVLKRNGKESADDISNASIIRNNSDVYFKQLNSKFR